LLTPGIFILWSIRGIRQRGSGISILDRSSTTPGSTASTKEHRMSETEQPQEQPEQPEEDQSPEEQPEQSPQEPQEQPQEEPEEPTTEEHETVQQDESA